MAATCAQEGSDYQMYLLCPAEPELNEREKRAAAVVDDVAGRRLPLRQKRAITATGVRTSRAARSVRTGATTDR